MVYKSGLLYHAKAIHGCLPSLGLEANIDLRGFQLVVRGRNRYYEFFPQFLAMWERDGKPRYLARPQAEAIGFVGWLPYFNKQWSLARDKVLFKDYCRNNGLRTPQSWTEPGDSMRDFIVKRRLSSFGDGIRGPFRDLDSAGADHAAKDGGYYEQFIAGAILKAWYWDEKLACLEVRTMPTITGDGRRTMHELIAAQVLYPQVPPERALISDLARYHGISADAVVPAGRTLIADFRYLSGLFPLSAKNSNVLAQYVDTDVGRQLAEAGPALWRGIPEQIRAGTLFSLDAILDPESRVWFLEMNCNPMVHPDAYPAMLQSLFGSAEARVVRQPAAARPAVTVTVSPAAVAPPGSEGVQRA